MLFSTGGTPLGAVLISVPARDAARYSLMVILMKKLFFTLIFSLCLICNVYAYEIPDKSYYITFDTSNYGQVDAYIPYNYADFFSPSGHSIVNVYSSTVTGFAVIGNNQYNIRFTTFDLPQVRALDNSYTWDYLEGVSIVDTNLPILNDTSFSLLSQSTVINLLILLCGGVIICLLFMKR